MSLYTCYVCKAEIFVAEDGYPHTYHGEECPVRTLEPCRVGVDAVCTKETGCGEDCHESCCPVCTGQALDPDSIP